MRHYDLAPLYRSGVGFDRLFSLIDQVDAFDQPTTAYPPYNIEKTGENTYRITLAVAGFSPDELALESHENALLVRGEKQACPQSRAFLHQGIAARAFERRFQLADYVSVAHAALENGLLHIDLVREVPETKKPRRIEIAATPLSEARVVEGNAVAH
jgi:molecular chaperone IbpA